MHLSFILREGEKYKFQKGGGGGGYKNFNGNKGPWNKKVYGIARVVDTRIGLFISDLCWFVFLTGNPQL